MYNFCLNVDDSISCEATVQDELKEYAAALLLAENNLKEAQAKLDERNAALAMKERDCHSIEGRFRAAQIDLKMLQVGHCTRIQGSPMKVFFPTQSDLI